VPFEKYDTDGDLIPDIIDNRPTFPNPGQKQCAGSISGVVTLQSVAPDNQSEQITFEIRRPDTNAIAAYAINDEDPEEPGSQVTTASDGTYGLLEVPVGTYDLTAKGNKWLRMRQSNVVVTAGNTTTVDFPTLRGGDANDSNSVNVLDLNILKGTYGRMKGQPGYDARADFDKNNSVNVRDLNILKNNYGQSGAQ
jgi:hypothetical protein